MSRPFERRKKDFLKRRLFVIDIENVVGAGAIDERMCERAEQRVNDVCRPGDNDLIVIGVSHSMNVMPESAWKGARIVLRHGHNGADLALEDVLSNESVENRFSEVVIFSGDGLFARQAARLKRLGVKVTVSARAHELARVLAQCCSVVRLVPEMSVA